MSDSEYSFIKNDVIRRFDCIFIWPYHIHTNAYFNPFISVSQVIGREGQGVYVLMSGLDIENGVVASMPVG